MAKTKPASNLAEPAAAVVTGPSPAHVLTAALGMGTTAARQTAAKLDAETQAAIVQIYTSDTSDKSTKIRCLLPST